MSAEEYLACRSGAVVDLWEPRQAYFGAVEAGKKRLEKSWVKATSSVLTLMDKYSENARVL